MNITRLQETLDRLHANVTLLEAKNKSRNKVYYANHFMANSGNHTENATTLLDAVYSVYKAFSENVENVDWQIMVGRMINRNIGNVNVDELIAMVSNYDRMSVPIKVIVKRIINDIRQGNGDQYMPPAPAH
jgi:hypothetical protein